MTTLPRTAGVAFKAFHLADALADPAPPGFVEVHAENYFGAGGPPHRQLEAIVERTALSIHGVGLDLGGTEPPCAAHLARLRSLLDRYRPAAFSEHLAWSSDGGEFQADLLPTPLTQAQLDRTVAHVDEVQQRLGRRVLIENPSRYLAWAADALPETAFLAELADRTDCGLLLDVNNVYVSAHNLGFDAQTYLRELPLARVGEIHLAGHARDPRSRLLIDDHGSRVAPAVWALYAEVVARAGALPTLIEWDTQPPAWRVLCDEAAKARGILDDVRAAA